MLNSNTIKNEIKGLLETSAGGLFNFEKMPNHIKYDQNENGTAKLNSNNEIIIIKEFELPALEYIVSAIDSGIIEAFKTSGTLDDFSDVEYNNLSKNDLLVYNGVDWVNTSVSGINLSGSGVSSNKIPLNYVPKSDGIGGWNSTSIYEDSERKIKIQYGTSINEFSTDGTLSGNSDLALPTEKAVKTYVDSNAAHNLLSTIHSDTLADSVVDGDIIIGNVTPKWSRLAISIPASNVRNILGVDSGELRLSWKAALDSTNPTTIGVGDSAAPGTSLVFSHRDHQHASPATWTPSAHNVLNSTYHSDVLTGSIIRGDILYGNSTPKIARLAKGNDGQYLKSGATDVAWADLPGSFSGFANPSAAVGNMVVNGSATTAMRSDAAPALGNLGTAGVHAKFAATGLADSILTEVAGGIEIPTAKYFGLGAAKGRMTFEDAATDYICLMDCNVGIGTTSPGLVDWSKSLTVSSGITGEVNAGLELQGARTSNDNFCGISLVHKTNEVGRIEGIRSGADDAGDIAFQTKVTGVAISEKMRITGDGNVGIGTTTPAALLEFKKDSIDHIMFSGSLTDNIGAITFNSNITPEQQLFIRGREGLGFFTGTDWSTERMRIDAVGNVGIGITGGLAGIIHALRHQAAETKLVIENGNATGSALLELYGISGGYTSRFIHDNDHDMVSLEFGYNDFRIRERGAEGYIKIYTNVMMSEYHIECSEDLPLILGAGGVTCINLATTRETTFYGSSYWAGLTLSHGMTDIAPTDICGFNRVISTSTGGFSVGGLTSNDSTALSLYGVIGVTDPTDSTPAIVINGAKRDYNSHQALAATETLLQIDNADNTHFSMLGNGYIGLNVVVPRGLLHAQLGANTDDNWYSNSVAIFEHSDDMCINLRSPNNKNCSIVFSDPDNTYSGIINYNHADNLMKFGVSTLSLPALTLSVSDVYTYVEAIYYPTIVGWSSYTYNITRYKVLGKTVDVWFRIEGTSNSATTTMTLPLVVKNTTNFISQFWIAAKNNDVVIDASVIITANSNVAVFTSCFTPGGT